MHTHDDQKHEEEYAAELTTGRLQAYRQTREQDGISTGRIVGYMALFLSLFSIAFYPIVFGALGVVMGLIAARYGAKTLGYTAIGFGGFSVLFSILYPMLFGSY
ncbi:permease [Ectobacillus sp. SYSU M60031]|uniref:Permease n=1 Tax=Ectobacillus ponti TaxID=2961894 RepID=A0AA41X4S5_9BACI|nr:permease [Ectobacillus ponti]MCP8968924.1 permease [Ectobacillus ponti]